MTIDRAPLLLRYAASACHFNEALPVGNGRLGAMVFGATHRERLVLNEDSCWAGRAKNRVNPASPGALASIRQLLFAGRFAEAETLCRARFLGTPSKIDSYQPMGELDLRVGWRAAVTDYRRWLDLDGALAVTEWREGAFRHRRTVFASAPDQVLIVRHEIVEGGPVPMSARLTREGPIERSASVDGDLLLAGYASEAASQYGTGAPSAPPSGCGLPIAIRLRTQTDGGRQDVLEDRLRIDGTRAATFLIAMATGFREADPVNACRRMLDAAALRSYDDLLARHQADHRVLFRGFDLDLGAPADDGRTVDARLAALRVGASDAGLIALAVQHRRYLLIAASRPGSLPSTLQGMWTEQQQGPWNCDFHFNINLQMNYWHAEPTGLGECVEPLVAWLESIVPGGERTARDLYGCRGWTMHHLSDAYGATEPLDGIWGVWPWGAAWMALHLHEHWAFAGDDATRSRVWPIVRGAARFALDFLIDAPPGTADAGLLTTCPSHSPENAFVAGDGTRAKFTYGATMDFAISRALLAACVEMIDAGDGEDALRAEIVEAHRRLPPLKISARTGCIQEWAEDYAEADPGHRHVSPLFDLHPGVGISRHRTPALAEAAATTLRHKANHQADDSHGQPGWTLNWIACFQARLGDGDAALARLTKLLRETSTPTLWTLAHGQAQVADACGTAAAVCEMLVQTDAGVVRLLPALPRDWPMGRVRGMRLRGGVTLDLRWADHRVATARFAAARATTLRVVVPAGCVVEPAGATANGVTTFTLDAGDLISVARVFNP